MRTARTLFTKSQTFVQKINLTSFSSFSPKIFDNFSREIKVVNSQKVQNYNIFTSFSPKKNEKLIFWTKSEDFEQCVARVLYWRAFLPSRLALIACCRPDFVSAAKVLSLRTSSKADRNFLVLSVATPTSLSIAFSTFRFGFSDF